MPPAPVQQTLQQVQARFEEPIELDRIVCNTANEMVAFCKFGGANDLRVVHYLRQLPHSVRIPIEFETTQLKEIHCVHLPQVHECIFEGDNAILVLAQAPGVPLQEYLRSTEPFCPIRIARLATSLFQCLNELHATSVEHLDICPSNIFVDPDSEQATLIRSSYLPRHLHSIALESAYCFSPEQAGAIDRDINASSDLYSAGTILFMMLTGEVPFPGNNIGDVLLAHMTHPIPSLPSFNADIPQAFCGIVEKLLQKDPTDRYQTASAVIHDLDTLTEALERGESNPQITLGLEDRHGAISEPTLVGRNGELHTFQQALQLARSGKNSLLFLEGVSGLGKSRILEEFACRAVGSGWQLFRGQCIQETSRRSLAAMQGVVKEFSDRTEDPRFAESFLDQFDGEWADLCTYFPDIRLLGERTSNAGPVSEQRSLATFSEFLNALGSPNRPALIILDDCQWADELTLKILSHWWRNYAERPHHVMLVAVFRSDEVPDSGYLRRLPPSCHIRLDRLRDADIRELAHSMAGSLPSRVLDLVVAASEGTPFMASAVVRGLVESRAIVLRDDTWEIQEEPFSACQSSSQAGEFLSRRLELMHAETLDLLSAAALLGREFDLDTASFLVGRRTNEAIRAIGEARSRNLLWSRQSSNRYVFSHDKIRNALIERIGKKKQRAWHRLAAEYLRSVDASKDADIAYHYHAAGELQQALPYSLRAAQRAAKICNFSVAKTQFQIAHLALPYATNEGKYAIETGLGWVSMQRGEYENVESLFRAAVNYARNDLENARALGNLAEIQRRKGNIGEAAKTYERALSTLGYDVPKTIVGVLGSLCREIIIQVTHTLFPRIFLGGKRRPPNDRERLVLDLFSGLSHSYYNGNSGPAVFYTHLYSLNLAERFLPSQELAMLYLEHLGGVSMLGMRKRVEAYAARSTEIRHDDFPPLRDGLTAHYLSVSFFCMAMYSRAIEQGYAAIRMLERVGDYWKIHMTRYQVAAALYHRGFFRQAIEESRKNYESGIEKGDYQASGIILDVWARAKPGDVPDDILDTEFARRRDDPQGTCQLLVAKTANLIGQGKLDEAIETAERGIRLLLHTGLMNPYPFAILVWGAVALRKKAESVSAFEQHQRKGLLKKAIWYVHLGLLHALLQPVDKPRLLRELGLLRMMQGNERRARQHLLHSVHIAKKQQALYDEAESLRRLGELGQIFAWPNAKKHLDDGIRKLNQLAIEHGTELVTRDGRDAASTISLADRFDTILDVGRKITSALREPDVQHQTRKAAIRLLRCEECVLVGIHSGEFPVLAGPSLTIDRDIVRHAVIENNTVVTTASNGHSLLCSPISVQGEIKACLYASHTMIRDLFGPTEKRLADFIATLAGASLENALGYRQLQDLNATLEDRVAERTQAAEARARELARSNHELEKTANDLRMTEEQLRSAVTEANAASEAKSRFLATMSHEIRTPMNGILGMTELAMATNLDTTQSKYLRAVKQSGQTLLDLLNDILDLSKIEAGKVEIESIEFNVRELVENAVQLFSPAAHEKGLQIICDLDNDIPLRALGDANRIRQVIVNLIGNAVKFTTTGEVIVSVRRDVDHCLAFAVQDTGIGIASEKQETIFEAFQQEDSSTTRKYGGTGLGLSICHQLAELMGGNIRLRSVQNQGSTFTLCIPLEAVGLAVQSDLVDDGLRGHTAVLISPPSNSQKASLRLLECLGLHVMPVDSVADLEMDMVEGVDFIVIDEPSRSDFTTLQSWIGPKTLAMSRSAEALGQDATLLKPLLLEEVRDRLLSKFGHPRGGDPDYAEPTLVSPHDQASSPTNNRSNGWRVLVADDCEVNQLVAKGMLEMDGFQVETASTGEEAVRATEAGHFDVILMDVEMPVMDGMQATREIRKTSDVPILALSAHAVKDLMQRCEDVGFDGFISKPVQPEDLIAQVNSVLSNSVKPK